MNNWYLPDNPRINKAAIIQQAHDQGGMLHRHAKGDSCTYQCQMIEEPIDVRMRDLEGHGNLEGR